MAKIYLRLVNLGLWPEILIDDINNHNTDPITRDLKTKQNKISIWEFEVENLIEENGFLKVIPEEVETEVMLTLGLSVNEFSKMNIVVIDENQLQSFEKIRNVEEGFTLYEKGKQCHYNIENLNIGTLLNLYKIISDNIVRKKIIFYKKQDIVDKVKEKILDVNFTDLDIDHLNSNDNCGKTKLFDKMNMVLHSAI